MTELERDVVPSSGDAPVDSGSPSPAELLAAAGWSPMLDRILRGLAHDLNGRVSSLMAIEQLLELDDELPPEFHEEPGKLERIARFVQLLPTDLDATARAALPADLLERAATLHGKARGRALDDLPAPDIADGTPAVLVGDGRVVRGLVLVLDRCSVSWGATDRVRIEGDEHGAAFVVPCPGTGDLDGPPAALARLFAMDGGTLRAESGRWVLSFPSLAAARARERAAPEG